MYPGGQTEQADEMIQQEFMSSLEDEMKALFPQIKTFDAEVMINNRGDVLLVEDWTSKSAKAYKVVGDMRQDLLDYVNQIIEVDVVFLEKKAWSGYVVVVSIRPL